MYFPVIRETAANNEFIIPKSDYLSKGKTILVVDDFPEQRHLASTMLNKVNYKDTAVASGEDVVEYLKIQKDDLIVPDMIMDPGIDGREAYKRIIQIHHRQKAIIVSDLAKTEKVEEAYTLGAGVYVKKPYILENIGLAVRNELDRVNVV